MGNTTTHIMGRLKSATNDLHRMAEDRELQRKLVKGTLPRGLYTAFLGQMYLVHRALEDRIDTVADRHPAFAAVVRDYHERQGQLEQDLTFLGADPDEVTAVPAAAALVREIGRTARDAPVALLGMLYVLEGSTNGSKFIARALHKAWGLDRGPGLSYLDPHGDLQQERWLAFKRDMDAVGFSEAEAVALIDSARLMFQSVADISDELIEPVSV